MLLDIVQVATNHSGFNLAATFTKILDDFGISDKVSTLLCCSSQVILTCIQILSFTCDNASNNDTMAKELGYLVAAFDGEASRTRCFAHIINLIAKSMIKQFNIPKAKAGEALDDAMEELVALAGEIEVEEQVMRDSADEDEDVEEDNIEDWVDEWETMSKQERQELDNDVQPVQQVLVKVSTGMAIVDTVLTMMDHISSARSHTLSRTHRPSSYQDGLQLLKN
jgi:hypothetical protein